MNSSRYTQKNLEDALATQAGERYNFSCVYAVGHSQAHPCIDYEITWQDFMDNEAIQGALYLFCDLEEEDLRKLQNHASATTLDYCDVRQG